MSALTFKQYNNANKDDNYWPDNGVIERFWIPALEQEEKSNKNKNESKGFSEFMSD